MKKWCNRFSPLLFAVGKNKIMDLTQGTVVEATGLVEGSYEQVIHDGPVQPVTGWVHTDDLEDDGLEGESSQFLQTYLRVWKGSRDRR